MSFVVRGPNHEFSVSMGVAIAGSIQSSSSAVLGQSARLLTGIGPGSSASGTGGGGPAWFTLPTQADEQAMYDSVLNWTWTASDKNTTFAFPAPASVTVSDIHNDTEADDLWNQYQAYKRTGKQVHLDWATIWRNYFVNTYYTQFSTDTYAGDYQANSGDHCHLYGPGLCVWGFERNDAAALATAGQLAALLESFLIGAVPGVTIASRIESRKYARWLLFSCYYSAINPIARWINLRDLLIDIWMQNPNYADTSNGTGNVIGGQHFSGRPQYGLQGPYSAADWDAGTRWGAVHQWAIQAEAFWIAYQQTGRADLRNHLIETARYNYYYMLNPAHVNAGVATRFGHVAGGARTATNMAGQAANTNPSQMIQPCSDNTCMVNSMVYAYKLTGEVQFLDRAKYLLRQGTQYAAVQGTKSVADNEVHHFLDTKRDDTAGSQPQYFFYDKGEIQYAYKIFENGGNPVVEGTTTWPPYDVPSADGEVIAIGTNVWADVRPAELNSGNAYAMLTGGDSAATFISSYSRGGAVVSAGGGGHLGVPNFGGAVFDFEDATWKRVWTGGTTDANASNNYTDIRADTRVHNLLHHADDLVDIYSSAGHAGVCWNYAHWTPQSSQLANCPLTPDPRDQTWEITRVEPAGGLHGWQFPGEWAGAQTSVTGGVARNGFVGNSARHAPSAPIPAPGHTWDMSFEITPAHGGGPKGSLANCRSTYQGIANSVALYWTYRFDLDTGTWHQFAVNESNTGSTTAVPGGAPWSLPGACAATHDPVTDRMYLLSEFASSSGQQRLNYMNLSDQTWRNLSLGSFAGVTEMGRTETCTVDPVRRLLIVGCSVPPFIRVFDLATLVGEPTPTAGTGGWRVPDINQIVPAYVEGFNSPWRYYPPNGNFYRIEPRVLPRPGGSAGTLSQYMTAGNFTIDKVYRLTPPPVGSNYFTATWTLDQITLSTPVPRPSWFCQYMSVNNKRFFYVPSLQCFAWLPLDNANGDGPVTRNSVYLIKPY